LALEDDPVPMKIISGGQSGVDRAALDAALACGINYGGWCPKGGWAEDFPTPPGVLAKYPELKETPRAEPEQRTEWNVRDADACLILIDAAGLDASAGTTRANERAHHYRKPVLIVNLGDSKTSEQAKLWLRVQQAKHGDGLKLAIGGPRESEAPGIYPAALAFIETLLD
jgi:Circularly permutated YpsA SLOG family